MAWRPEHLVRTGELDNTRLGWTVGWFELDGLDHRLELKLAGNCHPDLAGWKFRIKRSMPELENNNDSSLNFNDLRRDQSGNVGDINADQMIKQFDIPTKDVHPGI